MGTKKTTHSLGQEWPLWEDAVPLQTGWFPLLMLVSWSVNQFSIPIPSDHLQSALTSSPLVPAAEADPATGPVPLGCPVGSLF